MQSVLLLLAVTGVLGDVYFHNPRGSNNRLNERSAQRSNANRLFDSQNNNRGGYNVGDSTSNAATTEEGQYRMEYFQSSSNNKAKTNDKTELVLEWTNQHGCGGNEDSDPHKQNCNIVLQYMCQKDEESVKGTQSEDLFRNGQQTGTQNYNKVNDLNEGESNYRSRRNAVRLEKGYQEPYSWYDKCFVRERNNGLFTADQKLKSNNGLGYSSAIYTRQNANGNRRGYECPEERDYYPYWHPTPWKDIAVLAENATMCSHYIPKSFNTQPYHECVDQYWDGGKTLRKHYSRWNNEKDCKENGGEWREFHNYLEKAPKYSNQNSCKGAGFKWAVPHDSADGRTPECLVPLAAPDCQEASWTRSNHLGNGRDGKPLNYTWILPYFPSGETKRCILRIRYNISTDDYDPYFTDARYNEDKGKMVMSPVENNPYVEIGAGVSPLRLAINTAQFGRTFQDRSHVFKLKARPAGLENYKIHNLNVRGKRGNIVQVYPAVEYDFIPNDLQMSSNDLVHIQWTGSNSHNNGQPAGDGQAGDAGEGTGGTDRNNIVEVGDLNENFPVPFEGSTMWTAATVKWMYHGVTTLSPDDVAVTLATAGYYTCLKKTECPGKLQNDAADSTKAQMNNLLNNAPASFPGALLQFKKGNYHYICSRNNNFTNRSQKGTITVR